MIRSAIVAAIVVASVVSRIPAADSGGLPAPSGLMVNLLGEPARTTITDPRIRFSWIVNASGRDQLQTAYQVRVAAAAGDLENPAACLFDSQQVASEQSVAVPYAGKALEPNHDYVWRVRTWTNAGGPSAWSAPQSFKTGVLRDRAAAASPDDRLTADCYPIVQTPVAPAAIVQVEPNHYFIDFGRDAYAGLKITLAAPQAGQSLIVHLGEMLESPKKIHRKPGGSIRYHHVEIPLQAGQQTYIVPLGKGDGRRMPASIGPVMPFRYVEIENCPASITKDAIVQLATHYPFDESAARFSSSDKTLDAVWELCRYSMKATSFCGIYVDGDRERLPYEADAYINQLGHYCSDREFTLARHSHEYLIVHPTWPTEWIMHSVLMAWADYMHTGDTASLATFYDDLKAKTLIGLEREDGLILATKAAQTKALLNSIHRAGARDTIRDIVDWPLGERDGCELKPVNTVVNAFHCRALALMSQIAQTLNKPEDAAAFRDKAARAAAAFNQKLFNEQTGLYVDGEGSAHSSLHANMFPLAFGLVPQQRVAKVAEFVRGRGMGCSVYGAQYLMEALYAGGLAEHAAQLITAKTDRSWAHMLDVGTTITLEAWDNKYKPNQDWNHAWGAAAANVIPRLLMGIEPREPGFKKARIRPQIGGLASASMDLPTIRGPIHVDVSSAAGNCAINVNLPANMTAEVWLPRLNRDDATVLLDGAPVTGRVESQFVVVDNVGSGRHVLERK